MYVSYYIVMHLNCLLSEEQVSTQVLTSEVFVMEELLKYISTKIAERNPWENCFGCCLSTHRRAAVFLEKRAAAYTIPGIKPFLLLLLHFVRTFFGIIPAAR
jgi:hypothetical protein